MTERLRRALLAPTDPAGLVAFRVLFGLLVATSATRFLAYGWVEALFVRPSFQFRYPGLAWVPVPSPDALHALFVALVVLGALVAVGLFTRPALLLVFVVFTWVQLIDVALYLNHYVLVSLLALLLLVLPVGRAGSLDVLLFPRRRLAAFPAWCTLALRVQVGLVYTFAGLAKVSEDWLVHAQPLSIWLASRTHLPVLGPLFAQPAAPWVMSWAGCLFDLTIAWWLLARRTRAPAYVVVLGFHAVTSLLFPIGMFPAIMVVAATAFFDPSWPRRLAPRIRALLRRSGDAPAHPWGSAVQLPPWSRRATLGLAAFAVVGMAQVAIPLRSHLYGGDVRWHEQGMRLSWRVMVREKNASVTYRVTDPATGRTWEVPPRRYLTGWQEREFGTQPDLVLSLAHHVAAEEARRLGRPVEVRADVVASLNGRRSALLIDPTVDLARVEPSIAPAPWILPAPEDRPPSRLATR